MNSLRYRFPIYSRLLRLYPKTYRQRYEQEILQTTADMLDDAPARSSRLGIWSSLTVDLILNIARQNFAYAGGSMSSYTPNYIKRNGMISAVLLLPFFGAITANGLDKLINNTTLDNSWMWHRPALILWGFYLPTAAFIISLISYAVFVISGEDKNRGWFKRTFDVLHSWPVIIVGVTALGILALVEFHDSARCVTRSPAQAISHVSQTVYCIEANRSVIPRHDLGL